MEEKNCTKFPAFPFKPYSIQIDFMNALYRSLDKGGVSMLESPTGTGKTLSIICSALQWVVDQKCLQKSRTQNEFDQNKKSDDQSVSDDEPDWIKSFVPNVDDEAHEKKIKKKNYGHGSRRLDKSRNQKSSKDLVSHKIEEDKPNVKKEYKNLQNINDTMDMVDDEFLLEEYESEEEADCGSEKSKRKAGGSSISSSGSEEECEDESDEEGEEKLKIYFCSRTHSQLTQFVKELRKTIFANHIKVVSLGSRKNFCINEEVSQLGHTTRINERCLELQKNKKKKVSKIKNLGVEGRICRTKASSGCPMLRNHKIKQFKDRITQQGAMDIEDLVQVGRSMGTCPYYGSRSMVPAADLVVLPYQSLLSKSSRESLGLNLKNNIVIIDEAHNLADSLISMHNAKISLPQLEQVHSNIEKYLGRFRSLLGAGNRRYIQTLLVLTRAFLRVLLDEMDKNYATTCQDGKKAAGTKTPSDVSMAINDFLFSLGIDNINLVKLIQYIKESNIIYKVSSYGDKVASSQKSPALRESEDKNEDGSTLTGFRALVDVLVSLTNKDDEGRMIISKAKTRCSGPQAGFLKYVMLTGEKIFSQVLDQAHAVILTGGTLQPTEEMRERLFPWLSSQQLQIFSCGHIIPPESILPIAISRGPSGQPFDFSYASRSSSTMIEELGLLLCNLVTVVPEGVIVFFSSFEYEGQVYDAWKSSGILDRLMKKKHVFREPRRNSDVESVLREYNKTIEASYNGSKNLESRNGAVLLAIVGGKVSEGINFSDGMGRCILMVGLPYPSPSDTELMERVKHIEGLGDLNAAKSATTMDRENYITEPVQAGFSILRSCRRRGKEYYENLCMKAVNQSIGRAIRHINDYAAILLVDKRYESDPCKSSFSHPTDKLPHWIKDRLVSRTNNYGEVHRLLHQFFKFNKDRADQ